MSKIFNYLDFFSKQKSRTHVSDKKEIKMLQCNIMKAPKMNSVFERFCVFRYFRKKLGVPSPVRRWETPYTNCWAKIKTSQDTFSVVQLKQWWGIDEVLSHNELDRNPPHLHKKEFNLVFKSFHLVVGKNSALHRTVGV